MVGFTQSSNPVWACPNCNPFSQKSDPRTVKLVKRRSEMIEDIARKQRFFTGAFEKNRDFRGVSAQPCAKSRCIVKGQPLSGQSRADAGENVAHSATSHSRIARRVVTQRTVTFGHDRPTALQQERHGKTIAESRRRFGAGLFFVGEKPFHLARMRREQTLAFAASEGCNFVRQNVEPVGVNYYRLLCFFDE